MKNSDYNLKNLRNTAASISRSKLLSATAFISVLSIIKSLKRMITSQEIAKTMLMIMMAIPREKIGTVSLRWKRKMMKWLR